uniref:Putative secreted protein n=1 Tax=Anopheles darlingi TaxID=43151 RepID=A0A2M4DAU6_ANODA
MRSTVVMVVLVCEPSSAQIFTLVMSSLDHLHLTRQSTVNKLLIYSFSRFYTRCPLVHTIYNSLECTRAHAHTHTLSHYLRN